MSDRDFKLMGCMICFAAGAFMGSEHISGIAKNWWDLPASALFMLFGAIRGVRILSRGETK